MTDWFAYEASLPGQKRKPVDGKRYSLADICPRCKQTMTVAIQEHVILRRCPCGYEARDMSGETKLNWHQAGLSKIRIDSRTR